MSDIVSDNKLASSPMCPWCGDEADDTPWEIPFPHRGDAFVETDCGGCDQPITIRRVILVMYATEKREGP